SPRPRPPGRDHPGRGRRPRPEHSGRRERVRPSHHQRRIWSDKHARTRQGDRCHVLDRLHAWGGHHRDRQVDVEGSTLSVVSADDLFDALRAGARGYLLKDMDPDRVPVALRGVLAGEAALPRSLMGKVIAEFQDREARPRRRRIPTNARLSSREWEVADGLGKGFTTNEIADLLFIGDNTVRTHIAAILRKLRVSSREEAVQLLRDEDSEK